MTDWFERHLNWTLVFGLIGLQVVNGIIEWLALRVPVFDKLLSLGGSIIPLIVELVLWLFGLVVTWWYLGRKKRSKWYLLLLLVPWGLGIIGFVLTGALIGALLSAMLMGELTPDMIIGLILLGLSGITGFAGFIWLLRLKNKELGYSGDFAGESVTSGWPDTAPLAVPDDRQLKELDYTPAKNVLDMVDRRDAKDVEDTKDITDIGSVGAAGIAGEEAPAEERASAAEKVPAEEKVEEKVVERAVSQERLKMPILLDDAGAAIHCFYHPGADAVNLCSRCKQYVCIECNYVTGTHPICRNCWEKRAENPIIPPPVKKPASQELGKPEKQKVREEGKPEKQEIAKPEKSGKLEDEKNEWLPEFMALYEQASSIINAVIRKSADGMPASPLDLMEGLKLRPMLERAKKLSKPRDKELREAKSEFEQVLSSCIKIADAAADFVSGGGQALIGGPDFTRIVDGIETANGIMEKLSQRLASFSQPQE